MKISVYVKTNAKNEMVEKISEHEYKVWVNEPARENKANLAVIKLMSDTLGVSKNSIEIVKGLKSKRKILKV